jgi:hypothetical protein
MAAEPLEICSGSPARPVRALCLRHVGLNTTLTTIARFSWVKRFVPPLISALMPATQSNGKTWIASSLDALPVHDFGRIAIEHEHVHRRRNLLSIWRSRALRRLSVLRRRFGSSSGVARYLYNTNRCGIAHGKGIVRGDITPSYFEVVRDTYVLKLLARLAIDQKL